MQALTIMIEVFLPTGTNENYIGCLSARTLLMTHGVHSCVGNVDGHTTCQAIWTVHSLMECTAVSKMFWWSWPFLYHDSCGTQELYLIFGNKNGHVIWRVQDMSSTRVWQMDCIFPVHILICRYCGKFNCFVLFTIVWLPFAVAVGFGYNFHSLTCYLLAWEHPQCTIVP